MKKYIFSRTLVSALVLAMLVSACGNESPEALMESAKTSLGKNDAKTAIIQIKNALQINPDLVEARFLLGTTLLTAGDAAAAEIELDKARRLKYSDDLVVPQIAKSWVMLGKFKKVTDDFSGVVLPSAGSMVSLNISLSKAYAAQGKADMAQKALEAALLVEPGNVDALIIKARYLAAKRNFVDALAVVDSVIEKNGENAEALKLKGDIVFFGKNDAEGALAQYRKSVSVKPDYIQGHAAILTLLMQNGKLDEAGRQLELLKKNAEKSPQTKYFETQLAYLKKDFVGAKASLQQLLKVVPNDALVFQIAGGIEYQLNSLIQAEVYLSKAVAAAPNLPLARRLLILTHLKMGQPAKALAVLTPALQQEPVDTALYSIAGEVFVQNGDFKKAAEYFEKSTKLDPKDGRKRTSLALLHMMGGDATSAFNELEDIASTDNGTSADLALISARLRRQEFSLALKAVNGMEKKEPSNPLAPNLRGKIQVIQKDFSAARKSFDASLALNPLYFPAIVSLAELNVFEKKPEEAKKLFEGVLAKEPKSSQALLGLAGLKAGTGGKKEEVVELINKAIAANPEEVGPRIVLVNFYFRNKDNKAAFTAAQNAATALPNSLEVLDVLGRAQEAVGETNQAVSTYTKLASLQPLSTQPLMRLSEINVNAKNMDAAVQNLNKVLALKADFLPAQRGLIFLDVAAERYQNAIATARLMQRQRPKDVTGYVLEGDVNMAQKKWDGALTAYRLGLKETTSLEPSVKVHMAYVASDNKADADKYAASWVKDHPKDVKFLSYMADMSLSKKDFVGAEKLYLNILQIVPENAVAYNNLAWVAGQLKKGSALGYAEKANTLTPNQPAFMDTLAMLLADKGDYSRAIELQNKAIVLQPENNIFKLSLAKIYIKSGDKKQAQVLLDELLKLGDKFSEYAEVNAVIKTL